MSKMAQSVGAVAKGEKPGGKPSSKGFGRKHMEKKQAEADAKAEAKNQKQESKPEKTKGIKAEVYKVRGNGAMLVPGKVAKEIGFEVGMKYACRKTENPKEVLLVAI